MNETVTQFQTMSANLMQMAVDFFPKLGLAILIWILFRIFAGFVKKGITFLAEKVGVDRLADTVNLNQMLHKANFHGGFSWMLGKIAYRIIYLFGINIAFNTLGLTEISELISKLIAYIPNLLVAVLIILGGGFIANFVRDLVNGAVSAANSKIEWAGKATYFGIMLFVVITALKQAQVDISFITENLNTIVMGIMLAFGLAFGLGGKEKAKDILDKWM